MSPDYPIPDEHIAIVNDLLHGEITAEGAFCLAMGTMIGKKTGKFPARDVMERFAKCRSTGEGMTLFCSCLLAGEPPVKLRREKEARTNAKP